MERFNSPVTTLFKPLILYGYMTVLQLQKKKQNPFRSEEKGLEKEKSIKNSIAKL